MQTTVRESWTDERLDEFGKRMDERFDRVDERFDGIERHLKQVDKRFERAEGRMERVDERLFSIGRTMMVATVGICSIMIAGFGALMTAILTKL